jgi:hypothetical protein
MPAKKRPKFKTRVTSFADVSTNMRVINNFLRKLRTFLDKKDWSKLKNRKKTGRGNGGGELGGSRPPNWPP